MRRCFVSYELLAAFVSCLTVLSLACLAPQVTARAQAPAATKRPGASPCPLANSAKLPVDPNKTGGARGTQKVRFVVTSSSTDVEDAIIEIHDKNCKLVERGKSDDWGEYHARLDAGNYQVSVSWRELRIQRQISVNADTQEIKLSLNEK